MGYKGGRTRSNTVLLLVLALLVVLMFLGILQGPARISWSQVLAVLFNSLGWQTAESWQPWMETIVLDLRLPRVVTGMLVGAVLAVCGAVMQGLFRNPLASPSVLGVSSGASLGAVLAIFTGLAMASVWSLPVFSFIGAGLTILLVYTIASRRGHVPMGTLLLAGIAVSALNVALISLIIALSQSNWEVARMILYWTMGGLEGRTWSHVLLIAPVAIVGLLILMTYSKDLDVMLLGETHALSVGVDVSRTRNVLLVVTSCMVGAAVSVAGGIGFVGLVVPHILRLCMGPYHRYLLPASALGGGICLVGADLFLQSFFPDQAIPLGVATATLGAPFFLLLLIRQRSVMHL